MAIRITHGKASTIAQFGIEAGKGEQRVRQEAEAQTSARQQAQLNAQITASSIRANADIQKTILNAQSRQEAMEFESFIRGESAKRTIAWEQEKIELRNQHDFDMLEQRRDVENQLTMAEEGREKQKISSQKNALREAHKQGQLSKKELSDELLRIDLDIPPSRSMLLKRGGDDAISRFVSELSKGEEVVSKEQKNIDSLTAIIPNLPPEDQTFAKAVLKRGDKTEIRATIDTAEVTIQAEKTAKSLIKDKTYLKSQLSEVDADQRAIVQKALDSNNPLQIEAAASALRETERKEKQKRGRTAESKKRAEERGQRKQRREIQESLGVKKFFDFERMSLMGVRGGV